MCVVYVLVYPDTIRFDGGTYQNEKRTVFYSASVYCSVDENIMKIDRELLKWKFLHMETLINLDSFFFSLSHTQS